MTTPQHEQEQQQEQQPKTTNTANEVLVDYKHNDYRSFIFVLHEVHGLMLLHCTRKKKKPPHWQLPGGHIDDFEFIEAAKEYDDFETQLTMAAKRGASRELYEETGIDVRNNLERMKPAILRSSRELKKHKHDKEPLLVNEYKSRLFFSLTLTDSDFPSEGVKCYGDKVDIKLKLSVEHSGFTFEPEPTKAAEMIKLHSGGKSSEALLMSMSSSSPENVSSLTSKQTNNAAATVADNDETRNLVENNSIDLIPSPAEKKSFFCCCFR